ncbi:MAG: DUF1761 domain-containing protein [Terriglobales bacterium]
MERKINLIAVFVAAVVHFGLGAAWFTVFAQPWIAGTRMTPEEVQGAQQTMSPLPYFVALLCNLVIAYAIAWVLAQLATQNVLRGIAVGAVLGFVMAAAMITEFAFERRPSSFNLIAAGYPFVGAIIMGAIVGAWRKKAASEWAARASA